MATKFSSSAKWILQKSLPQNRRIHDPAMHIRRIHKTCPKSKKESNDQLMVQSNFKIPEGDRNKGTFLEAINIYMNRPGPKRAQVEFIYSAMKYMEEFGVHRDLQTYKNILDVLPKGIYIPTNMFQAEFMHYPKQQQCVIDLLEQMEDNGQ